MSLSLPAGNSKWWNLVDCNAQIIGNAVNGLLDIHTQHFHNFIKIVRKDRGDFNEE